MDETSTGVNTELETPTNSGATDESVQSNETSTEQQDVNKEPSLQDVIDGVLEKHEIKTDSKEEKKEESSVQKENKTESKEKKEVVKTEATTSEVTEEDLSKYPTRAQERIRGLVEEKKAVEEKVKQYEPVAQRMQAVEQYCQKNSITPDDFNQALELLALLKTDPLKGVQALEERVGVLKQQAGQALPSDLQAKVDGGMLPIEDAKEMARLRLEVKGRELQQQKLTQQSQAQTQQQLNTSMEAWVNSRKTSDPDFKPKATPQALDGKYELTMLKFQSLWQSTPVYSIQEAVALLDKAYEAVNGTVKSFTPQPKPRRTVTSNGASTKQKEDVIDVSKPGWARKIAQEVVARH